MAGTGSVDGLVSGMSTSQVISQLMMAEAAPQTALKNRVSTQQKVVTAYQNINTKMSSVLTAARALNEDTSWKAASAKSTSDAVVATATGNGTAQTGSLTFRVTKLAAAHSMVFAGNTVASTADTVMSGPSLTLAINGGAPVTITPTDGTLASVVKKINETPNLGIKANAVQIAPGQYTLQVTATTTGDTSRFTLEGIDPALLGTDDGFGNNVPQIATLGEDAVLRVGTTNPFEVKSATNTFNGLMDGLTVTATRVQAPTEADITVSVAPDVDGLAAKVQAMVDAANSTLSEIATQTRTKNGAAAGGPLVGSSAMQQLSTAILNTVSGGAGDLGSLKAVGVELTRDGKLKFNKETFKTAYANDAAKTQSYFQSTADANADDVKDGLADKLASVADKATKFDIGTLSSLIKSGTTTISDLNKRVEDYDVRLNIRRQALQRQFTAMETALGSMRNQSSWLSGQIAAMG